ncbi:DNA-binding PucR family transcriptional regulator [Crossiella equi]|uniref:DNA-binding PucR family transcriptional regulator n=1 Tax=Crossiella equi TaxID=130796 RepID=A0ABS5A724_9PSEU|nr:PucR family transcriptional regulator [Crossiella equi]MBP2472385.1 DNA-binding PucR family transcriptional regulator [Crossiella equi]
MVDIGPPDPGAELYLRAAEAVPEIAGRVTEAFFARTPAYQRLPVRLVHQEITEAVVRDLTVFLEAVRQGRPPPPSALSEQVATAIRRAQQGVPLDVVLGMYHLAAQVGWEALASIAEPDELPELVRTVPALLGYLTVLVPTVAGSYLHEQQALDAEHREARRALVTALLTGSQAEPLAERFGLELSTEHAVLHLRLGRLPQLAGEDGMVAARGVVRRLHAELPPEALAAVGHTGGAVLLPPDADVHDLVHRLHVAAGTGVVAGVTRAVGHTAIPAAAREAAEIAELADRLGRAPGAYHLDDVLLEYQLCRPGPGRDRLSRLLDDLTPHPDLLRTLRVFLACGHNRHEAAAELAIHRNTLNYRLRRIAEVTGHSPADATGARLLAAALTVTDFQPGAAG